MRLSLLWKILLSTSVAITILFGATAYLVQRSVVETTSRNLQEEVNASLVAYESLWNSRAEQLQSVSKVLSTMSDVRAAFSTKDQATIRDTAGDLWSRISKQDAVFLVADPEGRVIASLGAREDAFGPDLDVVQQARRQFPKQATGFLVANGRLFQMVLTPVYIQSGSGQALINILAAGYRVDSDVAASLKQATGGSEFVFAIGGKVIASTLPNAAEVLPRIDQGEHVDYATLESPLLDVSGKPVGKLWVLRSYELAKERVSELQRQIVWIWLLALLTGLLVTSLLARRILRPIEELDRAAAEIAKENYSYRAPETGHDELSRLAHTFNAMSESIRSARAEMIRQERISTIGRLSTSIVHDLRSPLAAIYGGAEMLVDSDLSPEQVNRLARNIYRASRQVQELLQELVEVSRGRKSEGTEVCRLDEIVQDAWSLAAAGAERNGVQLELQVPPEIEVPMERARVERAILNLMENAIEAMPKGGSLKVSAKRSGANVEMSVQDNGPGVSPAIRSRLFEPFVTAGKKNGLGLGLALSRQTLLDNGGDLWLDPAITEGARFCLRMPAADGK